MTDAFKTLNAITQEEQGEFAAAIVEGAAHLDSERLWRFFMLRPPVPELAVLWLPYAAAASNIIIGLKPSPERTVALRALLDARAAAHLAWLGEQGE